MNEPVQIVFMLIMSALAVIVIVLLIFTDLHDHLPTDFRGKWRR